MDLRHTFQGKKVFLTGHTGFKGAWLLQILHRLGAIVKGYALAPEKEQDLYCQIEGDRLCYSSVIGNVLDRQLLTGEILRFEPDYIFHLAAQPLVRRSYNVPVDTFGVNVMGTVHVLEALRSLSGPCTAIMVTTDKVYENLEQGRPFVESDKLGGHDPYSASKAAAELAIASYRDSYFPLENHAVHQKRIASVRAGNVIGGGDYADDRIIPDIVRSLDHDVPVHLRHPSATRPWQHVLEPLAAYLVLAQKLGEDPACAQAFNIGPDKDDSRQVEQVVQKFIACYGKGSYTADTRSGHPHEAHYLMLDNHKAKTLLGIRPKFDADEAIRLTANWYADKKRPAAQKCLDDIINYGF